MKDEKDKKDEKEIGKKVRQMGKEFGRAVVTAMAAASDPALIKEFEERRERFREKIGCGYLDLTIFGHEDKEQMPFCLHRENEWGGCKRYDSGEECLLRSPEAKREFVNYALIDPYHPDFEPF